MIYSIYKITNYVNNKVYIGFSSNVNKRFAKHKWEAKNNSKYKLYRAIRKHGIDNFCFEILYQSKDKEHTLLVMEPYFINLYQSFVSGYNGNLGGSAPNLGLKASNETKIKMSLSATKNSHMRGKFGKLHHNFGKKNPPNEETLNKIRKSYKITFVTGEIQIIHGLKKFCRENNYHAVGIRRLINNKISKHKNIISASYI